MVTGEYAEGHPAREKLDVTAEEYNEFTRASPRTVWIHGLTCTPMLEAPFDMMDNYWTKKSDVKRSRQPGFVVTTRNTSISACELRPNVITHSTARIACDTLPNVITYNTAVHA